MVVLEQENQDLFNDIQEKNLIRQYDLLMNCVEIGLKQGPFAFDKYTLYALNHAAVSNIAQMAGRFRQEPIYIGNSEHKPPHHKELTDHMDRFFSFIYENWYETHSVTLGAYTLWRLNWVHPFVEGNGRTARAACYYVLCVRNGGFLLGRKIVPERIRENRQPYYDALRSADRAWEDGHLDVSDLSDYLADLLKQQIKDS